MRDFVDAHARLAPLPVRTRRSIEPEVDPVDERFGRGSAKGTVVVEKVQEVGVGDYVERYVGCVDGH